MKRCNLAAAAAAMAGFLLPGCRGSSPDSNARAGPGSPMEAISRAAAPAAGRPGPMEEARLIRLIGELAAAMPGGWHVYDVQTGEVVPPGRAGGFGHHITLMEIPLSWSELKVGRMHRADIFLLSPGSQSAGPPAQASPPAAGATPASASGAPGPATRPPPHPATELSAWDGWRVFLWQDANYAWPTAAKQVLSAIRAASSPASIEPADAEQAGPPKVMVGRLGMYWPDARPDPRLEQLVEFHTDACISDGDGEANIPLRIRGWHVLGPCWAGEGQYLACFRRTAAVALVPLGRLGDPTLAPLPAAPPAIEMWDVDANLLYLAVWDDGTVLRRPMTRGGGWVAEHVNVSWVRPAVVRKWLEGAARDGAMSFPIDSAASFTRQRRMCIRTAGRQKVMEIGGEDGPPPPGISGDYEARLRTLFKDRWASLEKRLCVFDAPGDRVYKGTLPFRMPALAEAPPAGTAGTPATGPSLRWMLAARRGDYPLWDKEPVAAYAIRAGIPQTALDLQLGKDGKVSMRLMLIPAGAFLMGSPADEPNRPTSEKPAHAVVLRRPFFMGRTEVTYSQFAAFVADSRYQTTADREGWAWAVSGRSFANVRGASWREPGYPLTGDHPVTEVSLDDAVAFCDWLSASSGLRVRLPTEAEWEYACRAGSPAAYAWGGDPNGGAGWCNAADRSAAGKVVIDGPAFDWDDGQVFTAPAGTYKPNAFSLFDVHGNVWEWCADWYDEGCYRQSAGGGAKAIEDPYGPAFGPQRVARGGGWRSGPDDCRSARRLPVEQDLRRFDIGFRVMVEIVPPGTMPGQRPATTPASRPWAIPDAPGRQAMCYYPGTVTAVEGNTAIVNVGSAKGMKKGMMCIVSRGADYVCQLLINVVDVNSSAGVIVKKKQDPMPGDRIEVTTEK